MPKDVMIATLGASAAISGLVLVFLGLLIQALHQAVHAFFTVPPSEKERCDAIKRLIARLGSLNWLTLVAFGISLASVGLSLIWLSVPGGRLVYRINIYLFSVELVSVVAIAVAATRSRRELERFAAQLAEQRLHGQS